MVLEKGAVDKIFYKRKVHFEEGLQSLQHNDYLVYFKSDHPTISKLFLSFKEDNRPYNTKFFS